MCSERCWVGQIGVEQFLVGGARGEEVGESVGELEPIEWTGGLEEEEEGGSGEDAFVPEEHGVQETVAGVESCVDFPDNRFDLGLAHWPTEGPRNEGSKESIGILFRGRADGFEGII